MSPIHRNKKLVGAKLLVYAGESEEYYTFISSEAYFELKKWMDYRKQCGENISLESWLMRNRWDKKKGYTRGLISAPIKLKAAGVKRVIEDALWTQGIRTKLEADKKRHEFQSDHGFRKWFKTRCEIAGMKPINIEKLMGHSTGISDSYYRPTEEEIFDDYLKANDSLLIENESSLKNRVEAISTKNSHDQIIFNSKILEKEEEIQTMKDQFTSLQSQVNLMIKAIGNMSDSGKNELSKVFIKSKLYQ